MAFSALSLSTTSGVQGRPYRAVLSGLQATSAIEMGGDGSPGFSYVNGRFSSQALPYPVSTLVFYELRPGEGRKEWRFDISAAGAPVQSVASDGTITYTGAGGGAPTAQAATASASGPVFTITRLLGSSSTLALVSGTNSNLTLNATTGVISATATIGAGVSQTAQVSETSGALRVDYPVIITGVAVGAALAISGSLTAATVGDTGAFTPAISGGTPSYTLSLLSGTLPPGRAISGLSVTGTYTTAGSYSYTLRVTDSVGATSDLAVGPVVVAAAGATLASNKRGLFIGDSTFMAVGADPTGATAANDARPFSPPLQAMNRLNALGIKSIADTIAADNNNGYSQAEWNGYYRAITVVGALATGSLTTTAGGAAYRLGAGVSIALDTATAVDTVEVGVPRASGFGVLNINDGTNNYTVSETNATADYIRVVVPLTSGKSIKKLTFSIASGAVHGPFYVNAYDSTTPSVQMINAGARNWRTAEWIVAANAANPLNAITTIAPHIAVINLGINDWRQAGTTIAQFKANMQTIIDRCIAAGATIIILVVPTPIANYVTTTDNWSQAAVRQAYADLAAANPSAALVDTPAVLFAAGLSGAANPATYTALNANGYMYDGLHPKAPVYQAEGYAIADAIKLKLGL